MKVYYIGKSVEDGDIVWTIEGVFSTKEIGFENMNNDEFLVELDLDEKLPPETTEPKVYWWKREDEIIDNLGETVKDLK